MNWLRALGAVWCLPVTLPVWLLGVLPAWYLGWIAFEGASRMGVVRFRIVRGAGPAAWESHWQRWAGLALPHAVLLNSEVAVTELHELRHTDQWLAFGPLFLPLYGIGLLAEGYDRHFLEEDARRWAWQEWGRRIKRTDAA